MSDEVDSRWAFERYQAIRHRLPDAKFPDASSHHARLIDVADGYDVFIFDSFGVLNVGETAVADAPACIAALRKMGKRVFVLTNSASLPSAAYKGYYQQFGFDFDDAEILTSRAILLRALPEYAAAMRWAVVAPEHAGVDELPCHTQPLDEAALVEADGFILLSTRGWTAARQSALMDALRQRQRPLLVGNPDLVAPRGDGFSLQPGAFAHDLADALDITPQFFGKPYANAFDLVLGALPDEIDRTRVLMIGDTLHTDILGGRACGFATALVTDHGVMRDMDVQRCIDISGIRPDHIVRTL